MDEFVDLDSLPLRFNPPDGWRTPDPLWISLYQGYAPKPGWSPYPGAPLVPDSWPWWEENGTAWHSFFRELSPPPTRILGNWFSLAATALLLLIVVPFLFEGVIAIVVALMATIGIFIGLRGVIKNLSSHEKVSSDPMTAVREWAELRRQSYFARHLQNSKESRPNLLASAEKKNIIIDAWWGEIPGG